MLYLALNPAFWSSHSTAHAKDRSRAKKVLDEKFDPFSFWVDWALLKNERLRMEHLVSPLTVEAWCDLIAYLAPYQGVSFGAHLVPAPVIDLLSCLSPRFAADLGLTPLARLRIDQIDFGRTDWLFESWDAARIRMRLPEAPEGQRYGAGTLRMVGGNTLFSRLPA